MNKKRSSVYTASTKTAIKIILGCSNEELGKLKVIDLAQRVGVNRSTFLTNFYRDKGQTIREYIILTKISRAMMLLEDQHDLSIGEIARILGFCRVDYFSKAFSRNILVTPSRYRQLRSLRENN